MAIPPLPAQGSTDWYGWAQGVQTAIGAVTVSATTPPAPNVNDLWFPLTAASPADIGAVGPNDLQTWNGEEGGCVAPYPVRLAGGAITVANGVLVLSRFTARESVTVGRFVTPVNNATTGATLQQLGLYSVDGTDTFTLRARTATSGTPLASAYSETTTAFDGALASTVSIVKGQEYAVGVLAVGQSNAASISGIYSPSLIRDRGAYALGGQTALPTSIPNFTPNNGSSLPWIGMVA